jgi:hypothetical protein
MRRSSCFDQSSLLVARLFSIRVSPFPSLVYFDKPKAHLGVEQQHEHDHRRNGKGRVVQYFERSLAKSM